MRKYAIAGLGAVAAFSMSAFAATLVVDGGALQAGVDETLTCTEGASLKYVTSTSSHQDAPSFFIDKVEVHTTDACDGNYAFLEGRKTSNETTFFGLAEIENGVAVIDLDGYPRADDLNRVDVLIKKATADEIAWANS